MHVTDEELESFMEAYREEFGKEPDPEKARLAASKLLQLYAAVYAPHLLGPMDEVSRKPKKSK